ncbi:MAG: class I SAM-dependent methyltransferase [Acidobacteriota bacterium]
MKRSLLIARQSSRPSGVIGYFLARIMSVETAEDNDIALTLLDISPSDRVLDVGFGHGRTLGRIAGIAHDGFVAGVDSSADMVKMAARRNRRLLRSNRMKLCHADASCLPFADRSFDKALSVHTIYFWPNPATELREICRTLRSGGRAAIGFRYDREAIENFPAPVYTFHHPDAVVKMLLEAGFERVRLEKIERGERMMHWAVAHRPQE